MNTSVMHGSSLNIANPPSFGDSYSDEMRIPASRPAEKALRSALVVDDEEDIADLVGAVLAAHGFECRNLSESTAALSLLDDNTYDLVVCDYHMPGPGGRDVLKKVRASGKDTRVVILSGDTARIDLRAEIESGAAHFLAKPFNIANLIELVQKLFPS